MTRECRKAVGKVRRCFTIEHILIQWLKEWDGRPARLFCFIRYGRDARATLCFDRYGRDSSGPGNRLEAYAMLDCYFALPSLTGRVSRP
jgi:hypothetical protein